MPGERALSDRARVDPRALQPHATAIMAAAAAEELSRLVDRIVQLAHC